MLDQPAAQQRAKRGRNRSGSGPRTDRPAPIFLGKCRADDRETSGNQQRPAHALDRARHNQLRNVRRQTTPN